MTSPQALVLEKFEQKTTSSIRVLSVDELPPGEVLVDVEFSTLNYKDALAITGSSPVVRRFPMVPGIDFAGRVRSSGDKRYQPGDAVILNGWGVGESHWGGLSQVASVSGDWLVPLPEGMSTRTAMSIGTAGYTAMLCVQALRKHGLLPGDGEIIVTGANGGVGSIALMLLAGLGYRVVASTGRMSERARLLEMGAHDVIDRAELSAPGKPLAKERFAGAVDSVGSHTLANVCAAMRYRGVVTACGLAQGMDFPSTVAPFILRGVTLVGIDSVQAPIAERMEAWGELASSGLDQALSRNTLEVGLSEVAALAPALLAGQVRGRIVVDVAR